MSTINIEHARDIMGHNFFGIEEAIKHFGFKSSKARTIVSSFEIRTPKGRLITEEEMFENKDTHVLVAVFPMSILDIRGKVEHKLFSNHENSWYNTESFAKDRGTFGWHLVRKTPVPDSTSLIWDKQQALLDKDEETPSAHTLVYTTIGHYLATGERLFEDIYVRTSSGIWDDHHIDIGHFQTGLGIYFCPDDHSSPLLGVSSVRKSQPAGKQDDP